MKTKPIRIATIHEVPYLPAYFVTVSSLAPEGHYQCISHAPFSEQPQFATRPEADAFVAQFGVLPGNVTVTNFDPRPVPHGC